MIAAGVPCTEYSIAKTTAPRNLDLADSLVRKTLEIIEYFQPKLWWIENPRWGLLRKRGLLDHVPYIDLDYCQFSTWGYQKPTRFWCCAEIARKNDVLCNKSTCINLIRTPQGGWRHREALGGNLLRTSVTMKGRTPPELVDYLIGPFLPPQEGGPSAIFSKSPQNKKMEGGQSLASKTLWQHLPEEGEGRPEVDLKRWTPKMPLDYPSCNMEGGGRLEVDLIKNGPRRTFKPPLPAHTRGKVAPGQ